jgi:hypothetical protein
MKQFLFLLILKYLDALRIKSSSDIDDYVVGITIGSLYSIFSAVHINQHNMSGIARILSSEEACLLPLYGSSCRSRTREEFEILIKISVDIGAPDLLHPLCVDSLAFAKYARSRVLQIGMPVYTLGLYEEITIEGWRMLLSEPLMLIAMDWCISLPQQFPIDRLLEAIDLPLTLPPGCITEWCPQKENIMNALYRQLPTASDCSIARLLLNIHGAVRIPELVAALTPIVCRREISSPVQSMNKYFFGCYNVPESQSLFLKVLQLPDISMLSKVTILRIWLRMTFIGKIIEELSTASISLAGISAILLRDLLGGLLPGRHVAYNAQFLALIGLSYHECLLSVSPNVLLLYPAMVMQIDLQIRFQHYRKWTMLPPVSIDPDIIIPRHYIFGRDLTLERLKDSLSQALSNSHLFHTRRDEMTGVQYIRPRVWMSEMKLLERVFNLMIYSIVRHSKTLVIFPGGYCDALDQRDPMPVIQQDHEYYKSVISSGGQIDNCVVDYAMFGDLKHFAANQSNTLEMQKSLMESLYANWELEIVFLNFLPCQVLAAALE